MDKIGIIIQARMGSSRLKGKVMLNLAGKPVLWHVIERCKKANVNDIIIATSKNKENNVIEKFCKRYGINFFRGSENDVLERYYEAAKQFKLDIIVRITSDCPLISSRVINNVINEFNYGKADYISNVSKRSYPRGLDAEIFSFKTLEKINKFAKNKFEREHVTAFIYNHPKQFRIGNLIARGLLKKPEIRLCIDTKEDLRLLEIIYNKFYNGKIIPIMEVIKFLNNNPNLARMNIKSEEEHLERNKEQNINQRLN